jgi:hypothetical protein
MPAPIDLTGQRVGTLLIQERVRDAKNRVAYRCLCDCGVTKVMRGDLLSRGSKRCVVSCGCLTPKASPRAYTKPIVYDLIGQKIGSLLLIEGTINSNGRKAYKCLCDCGNTKVVRKDMLTCPKPTTSCGCLTSEILSKAHKGKPMSNRQNLVGKRFGRLIVVEDVTNYDVVSGSTRSRCICDCGKELIVRNSGLRNGCTTSCGCRNSESSRQNIIKAHISNTKYTPEISALRIAWKSYKDGLSFDDFLELSKLDCHYCGSVPSNEYTCKRGGDTKFIYNGLDRVDNSLDHRKENVVPCCIVCNTAKCDRSIEWFHDYISRLVPRKISDIREYREKSSNISFDNVNSSMWSSIKGVFNDRYYDGDLTADQFYQLSQSNCFYCGQAPLNVTKYRGKWIRPETADASVFTYNGLDRVDSGLSHNYENVVPCCKYCNFTKRNMSFDDFIHWVEKIKAHNA